MKEKSKERIFFEKESLLINVTNARAPKGKEVEQYLLLFRNLVQFSIFSKYFWMEESKDCQKVCVI